MTGKGAHMPTQGATKWNALHDSDGDYAIYDEDSRLVAVTDSDTDWDEANAHLISSSPELLAALKRMLAHWVGLDDHLCPECGEEVGSGKGCDTCYVVEMAEAAIKKVRE